MEEKTVIVSNLSEFQQHLVKEILTPKPEEEAPQQTEFTNEKTIFINASPQDIELAEHIAEKLSGHNLSCILPLDHSGQATPKEIRQDLEQNIELCDSMLVLYHQCSPLTVREFIHTSLRIRTRTNQRPQNICICKAPESKPIRMWMKNVRTHECPQSFTDFCVQQALPELQQ
uniref:TIR domain-containing protein n=1 Tax=uncultured Thiotrichaceae bacterium TaxID=298394 RepID=A0A6S6T4E4_9GAMM|nr:MAG: Unknown protein [uncultured Thiotrichaceae bacterium]